MNDMDERRAWLIALRTPGLGPNGLRERLDAAQGDIRRMLVQLKAQPAPLGDEARAWLNQPDEQRLAADLAWLAEPGHRLLCYTEADFPPQLENIPLRQRHCLSSATPACCSTHRWRLSELATPVRLGWRMPAHLPAR